MKRVFIGLINFYKKMISPIMNYHGSNCKFYPTCSEYTKQAIEKYGAFKGLFMGIWRVLRCNPFSKGGYDPLK